MNRTSAGFSLLVLVISVGQLCGAVQTFGTGSAVSVVDRDATFDTVYQGMDLSAYEENGLRLALPDTAHLAFDPTDGVSAIVGHDAFDSPFHYGSAGTYSWLSISPTDGLPFVALEMTVGDGFTTAWAGGPRPTAFVHWEMVRNTVVIDTGTLDMTKNRVLGLRDNGGFDELLIGGYEDLATAQTATSTTWQALALDNVKAEMIPEPTAVIVWGLLGALGVTAGWWRRRRKGR